MSPYQRPRAGRELGAEGRGARGAEGVKSPPSWRQLVAEVVSLSLADEARALGDTLPVGLTLVG